MSAAFTLLRSNGPIRLLVISGAVVVLMIAALTALILVEARHRELAATTRNLRAFDILLAEQTARAMQSIELVVKDVTDNLSASGITTRADFDALKVDEATHLRLEQRIVNIPQLDAITLDSADGRLVNFSRYFPVPDIDISDRDYYRTLRDNPDIDMVFSVPVQNRGDGTWNIYVAQRVSGPHDRFIGIVLGALRLSYFEDLYKEISLGDNDTPDTSIALWRSDSTLLVRYPPNPAGIGKRNERLARRNLQPGQTRIFNGIGADGRPRLVAAQLLDSGRLMVTVAQTMDVVLADWRHDASVIIIAGMVGTIGVVLLVAALARQFATYEAMSHAIAAREEAVQARQVAEDKLRVAHKLEAIGRLTSGVAHDFNNLLTSVIANTELLLRDPSLSAAASRRLSVVMQAADRGAALIRQLLAFSRQQVLEPASVDLNDIVRGMTELLGSTVGSGIRLRLWLEPALWPALVDKVQIEHLILNLAINARDAMPSGGILTIATANASAGHPDRPDDLPRGEYVIVSVTDTGTGMSEELQQHVFEPFFTTKPPGKGSGLGLSQAYGVARQSGGTVQLQSRLGHGTVVEVYLPRALADIVPPDKVEGEPPEASKPSVSAHDGPRRLVLLVDDDPAVRETVAETLSDAGFAVVSAESGARALDEVERGLRPAALLLDRSMPDLDGPAVARALRVHLGAVPVVFMSGNAAGLADEPWVIEKPFVGRDLTTLVLRALQAADPAVSAR
jgi:signal transduction histidine kinase